MPEAALNVLGGELRACSFDPLTGYWRDGSCSEAPEDGGLHVVCARMTREFLVAKRLGLAVERERVVGVHVRLLLQGRRRGAHAGNLILLLLIYNP